MRDTARAPQPPTDQPTGYQICLHGLAQIDQKCQFWAKFGRFGAKNSNFYWKNQKFCFWPKNGFYPKKSPKMTRNANFGPNLVVFGQKTLFFTGEIKSFVTHITENPPRHLVHIVFWSGKMCKNGNFWPKQTQNADFGPKTEILGPKKRSHFLILTMFWPRPEKVVQRKKVPLPK